MSPNDKMRSHLVAKRARQLFETTTYVSIATRVTTHGACRPEQHGLPRGSKRVRKDSRRGGSATKGEVGLSLAAVESAK